MDQKLSKKLAGFLDMYDVSLHSNVKADGAMTIEYHLHIAWPRGAASLRQMS